MISDNTPHPQNATDPDPSTSDTAKASADHSDGVDGSGWIRFGGLIKTLTSKSESIIETYRRDLQEFGTGLKKEIEVAHGSLETVGQAIDQLGSTVVKGTAQIISQGKEAILAADLDSDNNSNKSTKSPSKDSSCSNLKGYSRFEAQIRAIQGKDEELEGFLSENDAMESIYKRLVPNSVDNESFWLRYFYKMLKMVVVVMVVNLVKTEKGVVETKKLSVEVGANSSQEESKVEKRNSSMQSESKEHGNDSVGETKVESSVIAQKADDGSNSCKEVVKEVVESGKNSDYAAGSDDKVIVETKVDDGKPPVVEASKSLAHEEEEDLSWHEIGDLSSIDEKKTSPPRSGSPSKVDVRKRLSVAEEEEALSWDIEDDDDDAVKS
ncbi:hypothetical protein AHAS_Ahas06G0102400 [Arachis hypogaea]